MNNSYKIIIDSSGELPEEIKKDGHFTNVPLSIDLDGTTFVDDENFDQLDFLARVKRSLKGPKSACPSPDCYMKACEGDADNVYIITLSGELSGSYNSATLGAGIIYCAVFSRSHYRLNVKSRYYACFKRTDSTCLNECL